MNAEKFVTALREYLIANTSLEQVYSPALAQEDDLTACITLLSGDITNNLCNKAEYSTIGFRTLIRGSQNDTASRQLADEVFNALHLLKDLTITDGKILNCIATSTPVYAGRDENGRVLYNITYNSIMKEE